MKARATPRIVLVVAVVVGLVVAGAVVVGVGALLAMRNRAGDARPGMSPVTRLDEIQGTRTPTGAGALPDQVLDATKIVLTVSAGSLRLDTGCNTVTGKAHVADGRLVVSGLSATEMACLPDWTAQEGALVEMLQARPRLERSGPTLTMHWGPGERYWIVLAPR